MALKRNPPRVRKEKPTLTGKPGSVAPSAPALCVVVPADRSRKKSTTKNTEKKIAKPKRKEVAKGRLSTSTWSPAPGITEGSEARIQMEQTIGKIGYFLEMLSPGDVVVSHEKNIIRIGAEESAWNARHPKVEKASKEELQAFGKPFIYTFDVGPPPLGAPRTVIWRYDRPVIMDKIDMRFASTYERMEPIPSEDDTVEWFAYCSERLELERLLELLRLFQKGVSIYGNFHSQDLSVIRLLKDTLIEDMKIIHTYYIYPPYRHQSNSIAWRDSHAMLVSTLAPTTKDGIKLLVSISRSKFSQLLMFREAYRKKEHSP